MSSSLPPSTLSPHLLLLILFSTAQIVVVCSFTYPVIFPSSYEATRESISKSSSILSSLPLHRQDVLYSSSLSQLDTERTKSDKYFDDKILQDTDSSTTSNPMTVGNQQMTYQSIHLISLPPLEDSSSPLSSSSSTKIIKDLWKWKDVVLGDGRDYFIPRPRALKALSNILIGSSFEQSLSSPNMDNSENGNSNGNARLITTIEECAILSNCARMDVLLYVTTDVITTADTDVSADMFHSKKHEIENLMLEASKTLVSNCLVNQLNLYQSKRQNGKGGGSGTGTGSGTSAMNILWEGLSSFLDLPGMVITDAETNQSNECDKNDITSTTPSITNSNTSETSQTLTTLLESKSQLNDILLHFCLVASGLAKRNSRPGRPVTFRPFSSRDAHIMLQLKRTVEVLVSMDKEQSKKQNQIQQKEEERQQRYSHVKLVLDCALNAGKAARDINTVPILAQLKNYDCEGKYSTSAPAQLAAEAIEDVKRLAIQPAIDRCMEKLMSQKYTERIVLFRQQVDERMMMISQKNAVASASKGQTSVIVKKMVHDTIVELRSGNDVDTREILLQIEAELSRC